MSENELMKAARRLRNVIDNLDQSKPLLREAYEILRPILDDALAGRLQIPGQLSQRTFFFGMYEDSLVAYYLNDTVFMNAIGKFDEAWRQARAVC